MLRAKVYQYAEKWLRNSVGSFCSALVFAQCLYRFSASPSWLGSSPKMEFSFSLSACEHAEIEASLSQSKLYKTFSAKFLLKFLVRDENND